MQKPNGAIETRFRFHSGIVRENWWRVFFAPQSHEIVDFDDCLVQPKISVDIVRFVKNYANKNYWKAYEEDRHEGWVRHLLIRTNEKNEALVVLVTKDIKFPDKTNFTTSLRKAFPSV
jgi:23S rRNA (uracil1939-C5)-methyltransferase